MQPRGTPHQISKLGIEIAAARIALSMFDVLPATHAERVLDQAHREIAEAAEAASGAGHAAAAREVMAAARDRAPDSSVTDRWPTILDAALSRLDAADVQLLAAENRPDRRASPAVGHIDDCCR